MLAEGAPITFVSHQLGHSTPATTLRYYAHWIPGDGAQWTDLLDTRPSAQAASAGAPVEPDRGTSVASDYEADSKGLDSEWSRGRELNPLRIEMRPVQRVLSCPAFAPQARVPSD
jgi:hypothetical protein